MSGDEIFLYKLGRHLYKLPCGNKIHLGSRLFLYMLFLEDGIPCHWLHFQCNLLYIYTDQNVLLQCTQR